MAAFPRPQSWSDGERGAYIKGHYLVRLHYNIETPLVYNRKRNGCYEYDQCDSETYFFIVKNDCGTNFRFFICHFLWRSTCMVYEVRDLFPWKMPTKVITSCLLNVEKIWNTAQNKLKLDLKLLPKMFFFRSNNIHREIDQWNRRRFGTKWNVTVPNSVTPVKPIVCKWIYLSRGNVVKWHTNYKYIKFTFVFSWNCDFEQFL